MTLEEYIATFDNSPKWFMEEVNKPWHVKRIAGCVRNKDYLMGRHKVLLREDSVYKGKVLTVNKTILQYAKMLVTFHDTLLLGKPVNIKSDNEEITKTITDIYKYGQYDAVDFKILDQVNKFGDAYEYIYVQDGVIKSKVFDAGDCYPVYTEDGDYVAFIEKWTDMWSKVTHWNVYYPTYVEKWTDEGGEYNLIETKPNLSGLPIHYHNINDEDENFGSSMLDDVKPILDDLEDIMSKLGTSIYVNTLNPLPVALGQRIESTIPADAAGYVLNLDNGDYKVVSTMMDYSTIKLYLDNMKGMLNDIACYPSALSDNTNIANISSVSLQMLFHMAVCKCLENEKWLNIGFRKRFDTFGRLLNYVGSNIDGNVEVEFNLSMPVATDEVIDNLKTMREMGAISIDTVMEKSGYISDLAVEKERIEDENLSIDNTVINKEEDRVNNDAA